MLGEFILAIGASIACAICCSDDTGAVTDSRKSSCHGHSRQILTVQTEIETDIIPGTSVEVHKSSKKFKESDFTPEKYELSTNRRSEIYIPQDYFVGQEVFSFPSAPPSSPVPISDLNRLGIRMSRSDPNHSGFQMSRSDPNHSGFQMSRNFNSECSICLSDVTSTDPIKILNCGHKFHFNCVNSWLKSHENKCPECQAAELNLSALLELQACANKKK